mgnify:CR=1 FL=1
MENYLKQLKNNCLKVVKFNSQPNTNEICGRGIKQPPQAAELNSSENFFYSVFLKSFAGTWVNVRS